MELFETPVRVFTIANGDLRLAISKINPDGVYLLWPITDNIFQAIFAEFPASEIMMDGINYNAVQYTREVDALVKSFADILIGLRLAAPNALAHKFQIELPMINGSK